MNTSTLRRLSGYAAIVAGPLCLLGGVLHPIENGHAHTPEALMVPHTVSSAALLTGTLLLLLGLPGVYGHVADRIGRLGLVGYVLYFLGNVLSAIPHLVLSWFVAGELAVSHPELVSAQDAIIGIPAFEVQQLTSALVLIVGLLVFGIALVRGRGIPRWIGWAGVAGALVMFAPLPTMPVVSGLQIELLRAAMLVGLGLLAIRSTAVEPVRLDQGVEATISRV